MLSGGSRESQRNPAEAYRSRALRVHALTLAHVATWSRNNREMGRKPHRQAGGAGRDSSVNGAAWRRVAGGCGTWAPTPWRTVRHGKAAGARPCPQQRAPAAGRVVVANVDHPRRSLPERDRVARSHVRDRARHLRWFGRPAVGGLEPESKGHPSSVLGPDGLLESNQRPRRSTAASRKPAAAGKCLFLCPRAAYGVSGCVPQSPLNSLMSGVCVTWKRPLPSALTV
jgi:hypothetical protein